VHMHNFKNMHSNVPEDKPHKDNRRNATLTCVVRAHVTQGRHTWEAEECWN
jgi:hypothetical protein